MIVRVIVVLNRSVVDSDCRFDNLGLAIRVKVSRFTSFDGIKLWLLT